MWLWRTLFVCATLAAIHGAPNRATSSAGEMNAYDTEEIEQNYLYSDETRVVHLPLEEESKTMSDSELRHNAKELLLEEREIRSEISAGSDSPRYGAIVANKGHELEDIIVTNLTTPRPNKDEEGRQGGDSPGVPVGGVSTQGPVTTVPGLDTGGSSASVPSEDLASLPGGGASPPTVTGSPQQGGSVTPPSSQNVNTSPAGQGTDLQGSSVSSTSGLPGDLGTPPGGGASPPTVTGSPQQGGSVTSPSSPPNVATSPAGQGANLQGSGLSSVSGPSGDQGTPPEQGASSLAPSPRVPQQGGGGISPSSQNANAPLAGQGASDQGSISSAPESTDQLLEKSIHELPTTSKDTSNPKEPGPPTDRNRPIAGDEGADDHNDPDEPFEEPPTENHDDEDEVHEEEDMQTLVSSDPVHSAIGEDDPELEDDALCRQAPGCKTHIDDDAEEEFESIADTGLENPNENGDPNTNESSCVGRSDCILLMQNNTMFGPFDIQDLIARIGNLSKNVILTINGQKIPGTLYGPLFAKARSRSTTTTTTVSSPPDVQSKRISKSKKPKVLAPLAAVYCGLFKKC